MHQPSRYMKIMKNKHMATHLLTRAVLARVRPQIIRMYYCQRSYRCLQLLADLYVCILNERIHEVLCIAY